MSEANRLSKSGMKLFPLLNRLITDWMTAAAEITTPYQQIRKLKIKLKNSHLLKNLTLLRQKINENREKPNVIKKEIITLQQSKFSLKELKTLQYRLMTLKLNAEKLIAEKELIRLYNI